jgi:hypothetical protein
MDLLKIDYLQHAGTNMTNYLSVPYEDVFIMGATNRALNEVEPVNPRSRGYRRLRLEDT